MQTSPPQILVVDDNPTNLKLVAQVLECAGFNVLKAEDAETAQVVLHGAKPELILMDIALPGMDGLTLPANSKRIQEPGTSASLLSPHSL